LAWRIDAEVHQHLLDLRGIGAHSRQIGRQIFADLNVLADHLVEQIHDVVDGLIQTEASRLEDLPPGERQ